MMATATKAVAKVAMEVTLSLKMNEDNKGDVESNLVNLTFSHSLLFVSYFP